MSAIKKLKQDFYDMDDICKIFSIKKQTAYNWVQQGLLKSYKITKKSMFKKKEVEALATKLLENSTK